MELDENILNFLVKLKNNVHWGLRYTNIKPLYMYNLIRHKNSLDECNLDICNIFDIINICNSKYKTHFYFYDENIYCINYNRLYYVIKILYMTFTKSRKTNNSYNI